MNGDTFFLSDIIGRTTKVDRAKYIEPIKS